MLHSVSGELVGYDLYQLYSIIFPLLNRYSKPHYGHGGPSLAYLGHQKVEKQSEKGRWFKEGPCK